MPRLPQEGTPRPARAKKYVFPARSRPVLWASLVVSVTVAALLVGGYAAGARRSLSPGDVAAHHARIDVKCSQCHEPGREVAAVRCERCHDPLTSGRLMHSAHVFVGSGDPRRAEASEDLACSSCHSEHRGRGADLAAVDDRECATCHLFSSLSAHSEFAAVKAGATAGVGLQFNHLKHFEEFAKAQGGSCELCHRPTADRRGFAPISFDRDCTMACHAVGPSETLDLEGLVLPSLLPEPWRSGTSVTLEPPDPNVPKEVTIVGPRHRDSWVLYNAHALRYSLDSDGAEAERLVLGGRIAYLRQFQTTRPTRAPLPDELADTERSLIDEIASLNARISAPAPDATALLGLLESAQAIARQLPGGNDLQANDAPQILDQGATGVPPTPPGNDLEQLAQYKQNLDRLLEIIIDRASDDALRRRAIALRDRVAHIDPSKAGAAMDPRMLSEQLQSLDSVLAAMRRIPDAGLQTQLNDFEVLRSFGQQQLARGLSPFDFEARKSELLAVLDSIERRGNPELRPSVASLRQRIIQLRPGSSGDGELTRSLKQRQRQLARVRLELELLRSHDAYEQAPTQDAAVDPEMLKQTVARLQRQLDDVEGSRAMTVADTDEERATRRSQLDAILGPIQVIGSRVTRQRCLKCHDYDSSGVRLAPVRITEPVMTRSLFNHAPHTTQTVCATCHQSVLTSAKSTDMNSPGVDTCQSCHAPSKVRSDCRTCHVYHPSSPAKMLTVSR